MSWLHKLRNVIPTREQLAAGRFTRWLAPWLGERRLWRLSRQGVALGMAIGIFFGLLIPVAQIPASAAVAIALRANLPAAMGSTLVTNPVTFAPIYFLAYKTGSRLTGQPVHDSQANLARIHEAMQARASSNDSPSTWQRLHAMGKPLIVGLLVFAIAGGLLTYALVSGSWWLWQRMRWRRRRAALARRSTRH
ncbi:MAG: DUF2062 domain-containing protein [Pseudomonadota bacterium]|nr:DUF2062 domain-containing protein [Pseudomonadota bacterium]